MFIVLRRLAYLLVWVVLACDRPAPPVAAPRIGVCATVYPLADVLRQVGGDAVEVDWIVDLGDLAAGFSLTSNERSRLTNVELLLWDGDRSESWASQSAAAIENAGKTLALSTQPIASTVPVEGFLWLDPLVIRELAPHLAEKLRRRLPQREQEFAERAKTFAADIDQVLQKYPNSRFGRSRVMVMSGGLNVLLDRFGIPATRLDANPLRLTDDALQRARTLAQRDNIKALLLPFDTPPGTAADIEARTGLHVFLIDHLGHPSYAGHGSYLEILDYNLNQLIAATSI
ncbi:MAG TPA: metal ABC transporter substrate-binding protein [Tepidisphaeraceae bacterium]